MSLNFDNIQSVTTASRGDHGLPEIIIEYRRTFLQRLFRKPPITRRFVKDVMYWEDYEWVDTGLNEFVKDGDGRLLDNLFRAYSSQDE